MCDIYCVLIAQTLYTRASNCFICCVVLALQVNVVSNDRLVQEAVSEDDFITIPVSNEWLVMARKLIASGVVLPTQYPPARVPRTWGDRPDSGTGVRQRLVEVADSGQCGSSSGDEWEGLSDSDKLHKFLRSIVDESESEDEGSEFWDAESDTEEEGNEFSDNAELTDSDGDNSQAKPERPTFPGLIEGVSGSRPGAPADPGSFLDGLLGEAGKGRVKAIFYDLDDF
jgi:hypothetical protein